MLKPYRCSRCHGPISGVDSDTAWAICDECAKKAYGQPVPDDKWVWRKVAWGNDAPAWHLTTGDDALDQGRIAAGCYWDEALGWLRQYRKILDDYARPDLSGTWERERNALDALIARVQSCIDNPPADEG